MFQIGSIQRQTTCLESSVLASHRQQRFLGSVTMARLAGREGKDQDAAGSGEGVAPPSRLCWIEAIVLCLFCCRREPRRMLGAGHAPVGTDHRSNPPQNTMTRGSACVCGTYVHENCRKRPQLALGGQVTDAQWTATTSAWDLAVAMASVAKGSIQVLCPVCNCRPLAR